MSSIGTPTKSAPLRDPPEVLRDVSRVGAKALPEDLHHSPAHAPLESVPLPVVWALG